MEKPDFMNGVSIDEMMKASFEAHEQFHSAQHWEGFRWGIKTAWLSVFDLYLQDKRESLHKFMTFLEGQSEMSKRRQQWAAEIQAKKEAERIEEENKKKPLEKVKRPFRKK